MEIKFRGFSKDREDWVYGLIITREEGVPNFLGELSTDINGEYEMKTQYYIYEEESDEEYDFAGGMIKVEVSSVGQYTGFEDKNKKEVYGGDIVLHKFKGENGWHESTTVIGTNDCPFISCGYLFDKGDFGEDLLEIIGNNYEKK